MTTRVRCAWGKFKAVLPLLTSMSISWARKGHLYQTCVRKAMLHASECWAPTKANLDRLNRSDRAMLRWICKVKLSDRVATSALLKKLNLLEIEDEIRGSRLGWYGHVYRSSSWINRITSLEVSGSAPRSRPKKTWMQTIADDKRKWKIE